MQRVAEGGACQAQLDGYRSRELHAGASSAPPLPTFVVNWKPLDEAPPSAFDFEPEPEDADGHAGLGAPQAAADLAATTSKASVAASSEPRAAWEVADAAVPRAAWAIGSFPADVATLLEAQRLALEREPNTIEVRRLPPAKAARLPTPSAVVCVCRAPGSGCVAVWRWGLCGGGRRVAV